MDIDGSTKICGLIGYPISHTLSPKIHNYLFKEFEINGIYIPFNAKLSKKEFQNFITNLSKISNFKGVNITIPYKEWAAIIVENKFQSLGAVNCLKFENGNIKATNTDFLGFKLAVENELNFSFSNKNILIYGAGATAKSIIYSIISEVKKIYIINRTLSNAKKIKNFFKNEKIEIGPPENFETIDLVINSTPIGLNGEMLDIDFKKFKKECCFFDVIYLDTPFVKKAKSYGFKSINGLSMLIYQAIKSFEFWYEVIIKPELIKKIFRMLK